MTGFLKQHASAAVAAEAIRRSVALCAAGVPTPAAGRGGSPCVVEFDRVEGATGRALLECDPVALLRPLRAMHAVAIEGLPAYDPALRIRPRLGVDTPAAMRRVTDAAVTDAAVPGGGATLHGDFHIGQLIAAPDGTVWVVDLDDMAVGPPEADLANFAAHLATSDPGETVGPALARWLAWILEAWQRIADPPRPAMLERYLHLALVRRHLKLREAGRPDFGAEILRLISGGTARTSPCDIATYRG